MRLQKLQIKNFISIKQADIDFEELNDGVFLISGPTGSGKSSMLDAIHWVLFGKTLSSNRASILKEIRSTYAPANEDTTVLLTFTQDNKAYKVIRALKKDGGTQVQLVTPGAIYDKVKEANDKLEEIIGLTVKQFDQMVMLEQGNFSKFLLADSKTRAEILRDIFDTQLFKDIELRFKDRCSDLKNLITASSDLEHSLLQGELLESLEAGIMLDLENMQTEEKRLDELKRRHDEAETMLPDLVAYDQSYAVYKKAQDDLDKLNQLKGEVEELYQKRDAYNEYAGVLDWYDSYLDACHNLEMARTDEVVYQNRIAAVVVDEELSDKVANLRERQVELNNQLKALEECDRYRNQIKEQEFEYKNLLKEQEDLNGKMQKLTSDKETLKVRMDNRKAYDQACSEAADKEKEHISMQEEAERLEKFITDNKPIYTSLLVNKLLDMSEDGICPICGAPYTAEHAQEEKASGSLDLKQRELQVKKNQLEALRSRIAEFESMPVPECIEVSTFNDLMSKWNDLLAKERELSTELRKLEGRLSMLYGAITTAKYELSRREPEVAGKKKSELDEELKNVTAEYSDLWAKVDDNEMKKRSKNILEGYLKGVRDKIIKLTGELEQIKAHPEAKSEGDPELEEAKLHRNLVCDYRMNINTYLYKIQQYEMLHDNLMSITEPVNPYPGYTSDSCKQILTDTNIGIEEAIHIISNAKNTIETRKQLVKQVKDIRKERERNTELYDENVYLYNLMSGKNNSRISFETFVLHRQLEWILKSSNQYLNTLSAGQFTLEVKWEAASSRTQGGLEITITDNFTGSNRPAQTFSGGELFMLSLSLSLGLMTAIDSLFTARDLNILFCDEGFGTLDQECLARTLATLRELKNIKMVGIISHVQELIDTIPQGFMVEKTAVGSKFKMFKNI